MKDVEVIKARNVLSTRARTNLTKRLRVAAYCRVSTDSEDQLNSYKSQVKYYTDLIKSKPEWDLAGIYADEAITGTQVTKREDFQRLINDCMNGDIDMIVTKSISRFARNTLDTLKYVRMLKEKGIAVFFEEENINTLTMDGELLLVILSSVAQQEVENISANVKKGLKMKMQRGELVGFQGCLGYDYHPEDKTITVNEEEAEIVRYIFRRYTEGAGGSVIAHELENLGYYVCSRNRMVRGKHCEYKAMLKKTDIEPMVIEAIREIVRNKDYAQAIKKRIGVQIDTKAVDKELEGYRAKLREVDLNKSRLEREIDNLPIDAKYRERKLHDMTLRLDSLYDIIVELEEKIEDAMMRRDAIAQQAITLESIYKIMVNFDCVYNIISDEEKRAVVTALIKEIELYRNDESECPLKRIGLNFPVFKDGKEVSELLWDKGNTVETIVLLQRETL